MLRKVIIGSRGSDLALWQAHFTRRQLESLGFEVQINIIKTKGDQIQHLSFDKIEGKGFFTKELEEALLSNEIDLAVHSHKDLPTTSPEGLTIAGVSYREDCSESLLIKQDAIDHSQELGLKLNAKVGTSSFRRKTQLLSIRPDLEIVDLRGNVPTRVQKLIDGQYDAIVLASAGLNRLELDLGDLHREVLSPHFFIPAPAQGVLAFQIRVNDDEMKKIVANIHHPNVAETIFAERKVLNRLDGGCLLPLGVYCEKSIQGYQLWASLQPLDGRPFRRVFLRGDNSEKLADDALIALNRFEKRKVFISRESELSDLLIRNLKNYGFEVEAFSPITFEVIEIRHIPFADWVFFSSPRAVHYFYSQEGMLAAQTKVAALGSGTLAALKQYGIQPEFVGNDEDPSLVGEKFLELTKNKTIIFPGAENSLRSVQMQLENKATVYDIPVYRTLEKENNQTINADIWVLTSPSSVNALKSQIKQSKGVFVAMGQSTAIALKQIGIMDVHIAPFTSMQALSDIVCGIN
jgi:hydroxymethylbilane synthase